DVDPVLVRLALEVDVERDALHAQLLQLVGGEGGGGVGDDGQAHVAPRRRKAGSGRASAQRLVLRSGAIITSAPPPLSRPGRAGSRPRTASRRSARRSAPRPS